jgi:hypothetical protein
LQQVDTTKVVARFGNDRRQPSIIDHIPYELPNALTFLLILIRVAVQYTTYYLIKWQGN